LIHPIYPFLVFTVTNFDGAIDADSLITRNDTGRFGTVTLILFCIGTKILFWSTLVKYRTVGLEGAFPVMRPRLGMISMYRRTKGKDYSRLYMADSSDRVIRISLMLFFKDVASAPERR
jgi:hypothetical protein